MRASFEETLVKIVLAPNTLGICSAYVSSCPQEAAHTTPLSQRLSDKNRGPFFWSARCYNAIMRKPDWLKVRPPGGESFVRINGLLRDRSLHTVCEEAKCPNRGECWSAGTATFIIAGDTCTRSCRFCAVKTAKNPPALDPAEPVKVAECVTELKLKYVVLTSVDRDDLADGGAKHFAITVKEIKDRSPATIVEALVPDFSGSQSDVHTVVNSGLEVYAHNLETVARLSPRVRDVRANYELSLKTLQTAKEHGRISGRRFYTKSGLMLGLGETEADLESTLDDLRAADVDVLTLGQYLQPTMKQLPVERYVTPEEFERWRVRAMEKGFVFVASAPLVRSSYRAAELFIKNHACGCSQEA
jgi:lipoic acid synthetase